jgi:hypothetical protein
VALAVPATPEEPPQDSKTLTAPQPLMPPEGSKPSVHTTSHELPPAEPEPAPVTVAKAVSARIHVPPVPQAPAGKRKLSNSSKTAIAAILAVLVILLGWFLLDKSGKNRETKLYNEMILEAAKGDATEVPVNSLKLELLLKAATNTGVVEARQTVYKALFLAKATDGTDVDALIAYASRSTEDPRSAVAALQAVRFMAGDEQFDKFLEVIEATKNDEVRKAAEETLAQIIKKAPGRANFANRLATAYEGSVDEAVRHSLLRLLGRCGGTKAQELVQKALDGNEGKDKVAAIISLGSWADDSAFHLLGDFIAGTRDEDLRNRAFASALRFVSDPESGLSPESQQEKWTQLAGLAKTGNEQFNIVRGLANLEDDWAIKLLEGFMESEDNKVADLAEKAIARIREQRRLKENDK